MAAHRHNVVPIIAAVWGTGLRVVQCNRPHEAYDPFAKSLLLRAQRTLCCPTVPPQSRPIKFTPPALLVLACATTRKVRTS